LTATALAAKRTFFDLLTRFDEQDFAARTRR
jgi:hypothetical protein